MLPDELEELEELYTCAVKWFGLVLQFVPEKFKTVEICRLATMQNPYALQYVPEKLKTRKLCEDAVKKRGHAIKFIHEKFKNKKLCAITCKSILRIYNYY